ncbi:hypothetical protein CCAX7_20770 [Capsulimonas corticalis]|uniref:Uncharacterized protein n=1 Tax=Capsulimonas corticalis TaxID=2219043 RepID=A0A402D292_9BACT|nr:hypothetical protein [Capsulimonas corticalis]BDI30026.1 hypothetical protein CCAX7_20770 [Capsulimonas corticalis]
MALGAEMIFRVEALPLGGTPESLWQQLTMEPTLPIDPSDDFYIGGPIAAIDSEDLKCYLSYFTPPHETYIRSGLWLNLNLYKDYFGVGYERGDLPLFIKIAEWLEARLEGCDVFYGEDCNAVVHPFTQDLRFKLLIHYQKTLGLNYRSDDPVIRAKLQKARDEFNLQCRS